MGTLIGMILGSDPRVGLQYRRRGWLRLRRTLVGSAHTMSCGIGRTLGTTSVSLRGL